MTWYIFDAYGTNIGYSDHEPNHDDLADRGEVAVYHAGAVSGMIQLAAGQIVEVEPPPSPAHKWNGKAWVVDREAKKAYLAELKEAKLRELNSAAQVFINRAVGADKVPDFEVQTWVIQAQEAKVWHENHDAPTPMLDRIAAARGVAPEKIRAAAYKKAVGFEEITARVAGLRQALQVRIEQAKNEEELAEIEPVFSLGGVE